MTMLGANSGYPKLRKYQRLWDLQYNLIKIPQDVITLLLPDTTSNQIVTLFHAVIEHCF